jgi:peptidoglycan/xylan/chitin deacetylase (PgdA/CDA1 family)
VAPCYHLVSDHPPIHIQHLYQCRDVADFGRELDWLLRHFRPICLKELTRCILEDGRQPDGTFFFSCDDGVREVSEYIAPICLSKGIPATFFLTTGFLDNRTLFFRHKASILIHRCEVLGRKRSIDVLRKFDSWTGTADIATFFLSIKYQQTAVLDRCAELLEMDFEAYLKEEKPYLTSEQVKGLLKQGFDIGGHSVDHPLYADLSFDEQLRQTRACMAELGSRFGVTVKGFAFPFVSDGVAPEFYSSILAEGTADMVFCLGGMPRGGAGRAVERFGVEGPTTVALTRLLRDQVCRQYLNRVRRRLHPSQHGSEATCL